MRLALSKKGLGPAIENEVWHYAFIATSAKAIRGVILDYLRTMVVSSIIRRLRNICHLNTLNYTQILSRDKRELS